MSSAFISPAFRGSSFRDCHFIAPWLCFFYQAKHKREIMIGGGNNPSL